MQHFKVALKQFLTFTFTVCVMLKVFLIPTVLLCHFLLITLESTSLLLSLLVLLVVDDLYIEGVYLCAPMLPILRIFMPAAHIKLRILLGID